MNSDKLANGITPRKLIGTLALAFALAVGAFGTAKAAEAIFVGSGTTTIFDGVISSVDSAGHKLTIATNGNSAVTVNTNSRTVISDGQSLSDLSPGETVKTIARNENGHLVANIISVTALSSYGTAGQTVLVQRGGFKSKTGSANGGTIMVKVNGIDVTFHVNSSTRFFSSSFSGLTAGRQLLVIGQDTGSSSTGFVAQEVFGK